MKTGRDRDEVWKAQVRKWIADRGWELPFTAEPAHLVASVLQQTQYVLDGRIGDDKANDDSPFNGTRLGSFSKPHLQA